MSGPTQLSLLGVEEETALYHTRRRGYFTLNHRDPADICRAGYARMKQTPYPLDQLPTVIQLLNPRIDTWISQGEFFRPNRRVVNLYRIGLLFVDLDYYNVPDWEYATPEWMAEVVKYHLVEVERLPPPTVIISSGQGLQIKWIFDEPIPGFALPRWNACQSVLVDALKELGADSKAKDASRILRVVGTVNTKSGELARVIHHDPSAIASFEYFAECLLPYTREQAEALRQEAADKRRERKQRKLKIADGSKSKEDYGGHAFSNRRLAWDRLKDLQKLIELRGGIAKGHRTQTLFYMINFLLLSGATNSTQMWHEARELAQQINPGWTHRESALSTLYRKAKEHQAGKTVEFHGRKYPPLYTPKNSTLIDQLEITPDEEKRLRTIISEGQARERKRKRQRDAAETARRQKGAKSRSEYEAEAAERARHAYEMRASGLRWSEVGSRFGISEDAARVLAGRHTPMSSMSRLKMAS